MVVVRRVPFGCDYYWKNIVHLNWLATFLHLVQALVVCIVIGWTDSQHHNHDDEPTRGVFPLFKTVHVWHALHHDNNSTITADNNNNSLSSTTTPTTMRESMMVKGGGDFQIETLVVSGGSLDVRYVIACFFWLSFLFQGFAGYYHHLIMDPWFRFVEYSFSASTMILAIAVEAGVDDIYMLQGMFVLVFATMVFGIVAELLTPQPTAWIPHFAGWITFLSAYSPILDSFLESNRRSMTKAPGFVTVIVFLEFALFGCFGCVQTYSLYYSALVSDHQHVIDGSCSSSSDVPLIHRSSSHHTTTTTTNHHHTNNNNNPDADDEMMMEEYNYDDQGNNNNSSGGGGDRYRENVNMAYIMLSLMAKSNLGWLILSPILLL